MAKWIRHPKIQLSGGLRLDLSDAPEHIPLGSFAALRNFHHAIDGQLTKREGFVQWEAGLSLGTVAQGVFSVRKPSGARYRIALDTNSSATRLHYALPGSAWASLASFLATPYRAVRGAQLRGNLYLTNGADDLKFFEEPTVYGVCGVWPPVSPLTSTFTGALTTEIVDDEDECVVESGFLQYCVTFLYTDPVTGEAIHESPASARSPFLNGHFGDVTETNNVDWGYIKRGVPLTIPDNTDIDSSLRARVLKRRVYRRWKRYADQAWETWQLVQELNSGAGQTWQDSVFTPVGSDLNPDNNIPPIGKHVISSGNRLFLGNLKDRAIRQPSLASTWRGTLSDSTYKWTASGSGTNEYYCEIFAGGDPGLQEPTVLTLEGTTATNGAVGTLNDHEWDWGDNDSLGYSTIYFRDDTNDPDVSGVELVINGYEPKFPWRARIAIADTNDKIVTRGTVKMLFTIDAAHSTSKNPDASGDGAYLEGMTGDLSTAAVQRRFCFTADDGLTEIGHEVLTAECTATEIMFLVEIPELFGSATVYLFYGDTNTRHYLSGQWESVYHKLYAETDMVLLCDFDQSVGSPIRAHERLLGRTWSFAATSLTGDGGYADDDTNKVFSSGRKVELDAHANKYVSFSAISAISTTEVSEGTVQGWVWIDFSELHAVDDNIICTLKSANQYYWLCLTKDGADWKLYLKNDKPETVATTPALAGLTGDQWVFVSWAWGDTPASEPSRIYIDGPGLTTEQTDTYYNGVDDTGDLPDVRPYDVFTVGDGQAAHDFSLIGHFDEFVIWAHSKDALAELRQDYLRRTYWETDLVLELTGSDEIYDTTNDVAIHTPRPSRLAWSNLSAPDIFQIDNFRESDSRAELTGLLSFGGRVIPLYMNEIRVLAAGATEQALFAGADDITQTWTLSDDVTGEVGGLGCIAPDSADVAESFVLFYGLAGLYAYDLRRFYHCSLALDSTLKDIPVAFRRAIVGQVYPSDRQYWMLVPSGDSTATDQSQTNTSATSNFGMDGADNKVAQSFMSTKPCLSSITFKKAAEVGTFAGTVTVSIQTDDDGDPSGNALVSHTYTAAQWIALSNSDPIALTLYAYLEPQEVYHVVFEALTADDANHPVLRTEGSGTYTGGTEETYNASTSVWSNETSDLYFTTVYAYHDTCYVLDLTSVGPDPTKVQWTEFPWGTTDYLKMQGFTLLDDVDDLGELILVDATATTLWKYPSGTWYDDVSTVIKVVARTGHIDLYDAAIKRVMTDFA